MTKQKYFTEDYLEKSKYYVEAFTKIAFKEGSCNRLAIEDSINFYYSNQRLTKPKIIWFNNPKEMICYIINNIPYRNLFFRRPQSWNINRALPYREIKLAISNNFDNSANIINFVFNNIYDSVYLNVLNQHDGHRLNNNLSFVHIKNSILSEVGTDQSININWILNNLVLFGQHDSFRMSFFSFFENEFDLDFDYRQLDGLKGMLEVGWWIPFKDICLVSERPNKYRFTEYPKLGSSYEPAIEWEGCKIWINDLFSEILE